MKKYMIIALFVMAAVFPVLFIPLIPLLVTALVISLFATIHIARNGLWRHPHGGHHKVGKPV